MIDNKYIIDEYAKGRSSGELATELGTYPNKIIRILRKNGVSLRTGSESQKQALKSGRRKHPTEGKARSEATKEKIGAASYKFWQNMTEAERKTFSETQRKLWKDIPDEKKEEMSKKAAAGIRLAASEGSYLEKAVMHALREAGYKVDFHKSCMLHNPDLEVDLWLPNEFIAIEIDGPTHFLPIWGEEVLDKHQQRDEEKNGLLLNSGYTVIRVKNLVKNMSKAKAEEISNKILAKLKEAIKKPGLLYHVEA